jgi:hypothetical protein
MARGKPGIFGRIARAAKDLFTGHPVRAVKDVTAPAPKPEPTQQPEPPRRPALPPEPTSGVTDELPLSGRAYKVLMAGYGLVWFRPVTGQDEADAKDYVINMQGYLRGGSKYRSRYVSENNLRQLSEAQVSGVIEGVGYVNDAQFETSLDMIDDAALSGEPLTGAGWRSE